MSTAPQGHIFARVPALVTRRPDGRTEVVNVGEGWSCVTTGAMGDEIRSALAQGTLGTMLSALGEAHPLSRTVRRLIGESGVELNPANAASLGGFDTLFLEVTGTCNERCVHCYAESSPGVAAALNRTLCEDVIEDAAELGFGRIQFTGGDPLLCRFLPRLLQRATELRIPVREIYTNGLLLRPQLLGRLLPFEPDFAFSFYSHDPEVHDAITRTPGSQQRTLRGIRLAVEAGLNVRVSVIVMERNQEHVRETVDCLRDLGVGYIGVSGTRAVGRGAVYEGEVGNTGDGGTHQVEADDGSAAMPRWGKICVSYRGEVFPCIFNRNDRLGRLSQRRLRDIVRTPDPPRSPAAHGDTLLRACRSQLQCPSCQLTAYALRCGA